MRIGIIGAGSMGAILGRHLARLGHRVSIANSRGPESLAALAGEIGARPVSVADAAGAGEIVIVAIPTKAVPDLPPALFANLPDSVVVIDIGNYHPELRDGRIDAIDRGMPDSEWVAQRIGRPVIKAFNNIFAKSLLEKGVARGAAGRIALSVAGDSADAKAAVLRLVDDLGFDPVDGGDLADSWRQQPGTPAYCRDLDVAALQKALAGAVPGRTAEYRAEQEARIRKAIAPARNGAYTGGCACGAIRYATKHAPVFQNHCQCRDCQRRSGTGHGSYLTFPARAEMAITGVATHWEVAGDSGNVKVHAFCPVCGTPVFLRFAAMPELIAVHAASLDEPGRFAPQVLTYSVRGPAWDAIDPSLQAFERMPPA